MIKSEKIIKILHFKINILKNTNNNNKTSRVKYCIAVTDIYDSSDSAVILERL